jgi:superfamily II DNA/RNA helicase
MKDEQERIGRMNILIATPGRLLQHMDQSPTFNADTLQILGSLLLFLACSKAEATLLT